MGKLLEQAQKMQENLKKVQEEVQAKEVSAESGGGMVKATVNGAFKLIDLKIEKTALMATGDDDIEMLEDLIVAAVSEAQRRAKEMVQNEMAGAAGGLNIPGLGDLGDLGNLGGLGK